jgi:hypothetical protein
LCWLFWFHLAFLSSSHLWSMFVLSLYWLFRSPHLYLTFYVCSS